MKKKEILKKFTADFETEQLTKEQIEAGAQTYVWAWAVCDCDDYSIEDGTSMKTFIEYISTLGDCEIWFHNLKFDIQFMLYYLLGNGWEQSKERKLKDHQFSSLVSSQNVVYNITLQFKKSKVVILDSYKKLPFKLAKIAKDLKFDVQKGEIDYSKHREEGGVLSDEDRDYLHRDVLIPAKALNEVFFKNGWTSWTIGGDCVKYFKTTCSRYDRFFPKLSKKEIEFFKEAYTGGNVQVNPKKAGKVLHGLHYDINSEHPFILTSSSDYRFPIGRPEYYVGAYEKDVRMKFFIQHLRAAFKVKKGMFPTVQSTAESMFGEKEYVWDTEGEMVELVLSCYDLELFFKHYDIFNIEFINGYKFEATKGIFDEYIHHFYDMKMNAKKEGNAVKYITSKLFMNNLGGKFGQSEIASNKFFHMEKGELKEDIEIFEKETMFLPVSIAITSAARCELFKMIDAQGDRAVYWDTDSCVIEGDELQHSEEFRIDDYELGAWKLESVFDKGVFIRPKTYIEHTADGWTVKGAGMNDEVKEEVIRFVKEDIHSFKVGAEYSGKLRQKKVKGGVVLVNSTFKIK